MVKNKHILFVVENNSVPGDKRVWAEATAVKGFGFDVSVTRCDTSISNMCSPFLKSLAGHKPLPFFVFFTKTLFSVSSPLYEIITTG